MGSRVLHDGFDRIVALAPEVVVRVHRTKGVDGARPCLYSMHGGGYVLGSNVMDDPIFDMLCPALGVVAVSVEYRLAPDTPYPGPLALGHLDDLALTNSLNNTRRHASSRRPCHF
jgi:acetyl esterase/lipase